MDTTDLCASKGHQRPDLCRRPHDCLHVSDRRPSNRPDSTAGLLRVWCRHSPQRAERSGDRCRALTRPKQLCKPSPTACIGRFLLIRLPRRFPLHTSAHTQAYSAGRGRPTGGPARPGPPAPAGSRAPIAAFRIPAYKAAIARIKSPGRGPGSPGRRCACGDRDPHDRRRVRRSRVPAGRVGSCGAARHVPRA